MRHLYYLTDIALDTFEKVKLNLKGESKMSLLFSSLRLPPN